MRSASPPSSAACFSALAPSSTAPARSARLLDSARASGPISRRHLASFLGSLTILYVHTPTQLSEGSSVLEASAWLAILCILFFAVRLFAHGRTIRRKRIAPLHHIWSPHVATTIIGITFLAALLTVGTDLYRDAGRTCARGDVRTDAQTAADRRADRRLCPRWLDGRTDQACRAEPGQRRPLPRGRRADGAGAALIPGGNDGLVLVGMPLLWPYAWLAFASMCAAIYLAIRLARPTARMISRA